MKKAFVFFLSLVLVMSLALPAYAVKSPTPAPYVPVATSEDCSCRLVMWSERNTQPEACKAAFEAAKETVKDAVPEGFACRDLVYHCMHDHCTSCNLKMFYNNSAEVADDAEKVWTLTPNDDVCAAYEVEMSLEGVTEVVIKQFVNNEWVQKDVVLDGNVVTVNSLVEGAFAIFTK